MFSNSQAYPTGMLQSKECVKSTSRVARLIENVDATTIMDFIKETNFYYLLSVSFFQFYLVIGALLILNIFYSFVYKILFCYSKLC